MTSRIVLTKIECDHCGNDMFYVYEAPTGEQRIECEACGCVVDDNE